MSCASSRHRRRDLSSGLVPAAGPQLTSRLKTEETQSTQRLHQVRVNRDHRRRGALLERVVGAQGGLRYPPPLVQGPLPPEQGLMSAGPEFLVGNAMNSLAPEILFSRQYPQSQNVRKERK